jgi:TRAP-type C4-dicarboxylate transport system substrate-binding protein
MSIHQLTIKVAAATALGAVTLAGCSQPDADRAGGDQQAEPVVLTFSNSIDNDVFPPEAGRYADKVEELTGGEITFERTGNSREGSVEAERLLIEDVRDGTVDMAVVGVRVLDTLGVESLQPLIAPMVIDSYELQQAVFESDLPARMLGPLDELDVTGLAVIPGSLQRIIGSEHAFLSIDDFTGAVIASFHSQLGFDTYEALGAKPKLWPAGAPLTEFDATVVQFAAIWGRHWELEATAVTVNANIWVRPWVVVINPDVFGSLSAEHQQALREAATAATANIIDVAREGDRETLENLCSTQLEFVTATDEQLDGMRAALEPVYASISSDPQSAEYLDEIVSLKEQLGVPPGRAELCTRRRRWWVTALADRRGVHADADRAGHCRRLRRLGL